MATTPEPSMAQRLKDEFPELWAVLNVLKESGEVPDLKLVDLVMDNVVIRDSGSDSSNQTTAQ